MSGPAPGPDAPGLPGPVLAVLRRLDGPAFASFPARLGLSDAFAEGHLDLVSRLLTRDLGGPSGPPRSGPPAPAPDALAALAYLQDVAAPELMHLASSPISYRRSSPPGARALAVDPLTVAMAAALSDDDQGALWAAVVYLLVLHERAALLALGYRSFLAFYLHPTETSPLDFERAYGPGPGGRSAERPLPPGYRIQALIGHYFEQERHGAAYRYDVLDDRLAVVGAYDRGRRRLARFADPEPVPSALRALVLP